MSKCKQFGTRSGPTKCPNCATLIVFLKEFFEKVNFEKKLADDNKSMKISLHAEILIDKVYSDHPYANVQADPNSAFLTYVQRVLSWCFESYIIVLF